MPRMLFATAPTTVPAVSLVHAAISSVAEAAWSTERATTPYNAFEADPVIAASGGRMDLSHRAFAAARPVFSANHCVPAPSRSSAVAAPPHARTPTMTLIRTTI